MVFTASWMLLMVWQDALHCPDVARERESGFFESAIGGQGSGRGVVGIVYS